ncbi:putative 1-phosphatidylinositol 4,5-bisphosphate phosphodiesterase delta-1 [Apostichopus japonicus]|uniref:Putative 1-phosphatidylinositol 4,5-bisphosphate phosphodiesterase delta-1 n=1 Tax=Stichopus japonicus TaxID=307972 RepID=A0A2G8LGH5_STIJA|nr:putative 1-phosphatidylinositol 4,5-bisphosphate phosphodiesterase delta-1 [Apostichopus japonicus]
MQTVMKRYTLLSLSRPEMSIAVSFVYCAVGIDRSCDRLLTPLKEGTKLTKVSCSKRRKSVKERTFRVTENELYLRYTPSKKEQKELQVAIADIQEIRPGRNTDKFRDMSKFPKDASFSVILNGETRILNLVAHSKKDAEIWINGLQQLKKKLEKIDVKEKQAMWIKDVFLKADEDGNGSLELSEILKLIRKMNVKIDDDYAKTIFQRTNVLDEDEFVDFYREITKRPEVEEIFDR